MYLVTSNTICDVVCPYCGQGYNVLTEDGYSNNSELITDCTACSNPFSVLTTISFDTNKTEV